MSIKFDYDFGTREVLVYDAPAGSTVVVDGVKYMPERTCEGCFFDGLYANNCSFCNRDPRLTDQFVAKVVV